MSTTKLPKTPSQHAKDSVFTLITGFASMNATAQHLALQHPNSVHLEWLPAWLRKWLVGCCVGRSSCVLRAIDGCQGRSFRILIPRPSDLKFQNLYDYLSYDYDCTLLKYQQSNSSTPPPTKAATTAAALGYDLLRAQCYLQICKG